MRKTGMADISYCNTNCIQENCERNLKFRKPPTKYYSVSNFDSDNPDAIHPHCPHKLIRERKD